MKNKLLLIIIISLFCISSIYSNDFNDFIDSFSSNQNKITSFVGAGEMTITIYDDNDNALHTLNSDITIYMKYPDSFKLEVDNDSKMVVVQKGDKIMQKDYISNSIQTSQADSNTDLFKKYFFLGMEDLKNNVTILDKSIEKNSKGKNLYRFKIKSNATESIDTDTGQEIVISFVEYFFNDEGLLVKSTVYSNDNKELVATVIDYEIKKDIYIANEITITNQVDQMKLVNVIKYNVISLNVEITDKEFQIK